MNALMLRSPMFGGALNALDEEIDSMLRTPWLWPSKRDTSVPVDIEETDDGYTLSFDVPGMDKKDVSVEVRGGVITVSGERKRDEKGKEGGYTYRERVEGAFSRSFQLPENVSESEVSAKMKDGTLEVRLLKTPESKPKKVTVE